MLKKACKEKEMILAPLTGEVIPLCEVPDDVFSAGILGDGVAILPEDGKIYSPVDGVLDSVAETKHAFGFHAKAGFDVLVHVGLDTVNLKGEGFTVHVPQGESVKAGDLVAEVDLKLLEEKKISPITPVVLCGGEEEIAVRMSCGKVTAGENEVLRLADIENESGQPKEHPQTQEKMKQKERK